MKLALLLTIFTVCSAQDHFPLPTLEGAMDTVQHGLRLAKELKHRRYKPLTE